MTILAVISLISIFVALCYFGYYKEKKDFNNGVCPNCGKPLRHFDTDSQGGQGWCCDDCGYTTWISWFKWKKGGDE